jgi:TonB-linked SusC/RagA family outer membrane protein
MYQAVIGRLNYSFSDRYLVEAQFRYDGSSKFAPGHQWGFFPSVSAGWRISEEPFFKDSPLSFINQLKLRASYGVLGDDNSMNYEWISGYTYMGGETSEDGWCAQYAPGYMFDGKFVYSVNPSSLPNLNITWLRSTTFNIGLDFEAWRGKLGATVDYFHRIRTGIFSRNTVGLPTIIGASAPLENLDSDSHFGLELELYHRNKVGEFSYEVKGMASITRQKHLVGSQNGGYGNSYEKWRNDNLNNRYQGVQFGYEGIGRYESWEDIWTYDIYKENNLLPGDYKYLDWNGDGEINGYDAHPIAYDQTPWLNYSLSFNLNWKNLDFSMLLQGSALGSMKYSEPLYNIWGSTGGGTLVQYLDRWHPVDPLADIYDPATEWISGYYGYTGHYPDENSSFNRVSTAYLRLKSIEVGYTLPKFKKAQNFGVRIYANAYNPLTLTGVKFVDPEHPDSDLGRMYPLNKTYTLGLSLSF